MPDIMAAQRAQQQQQQQPNPEKPSPTTAAAATAGVNASVPDAWFADPRGPSSLHLVIPAAQLTDLGYL